MIGSRSSVAATQCDNQHLHNAGKYFTYISEQ